MRAGDTGNRPGRCEFLMNSSILLAGENSQGGGMAVSGILILPVQDFQLEWVWGGRLTSVYSRAGQCPPNTLLPKADLMLWSKKFCRRGSVHQDDAELAPCWRKLTTNPRSYQRVGCLRELRGANKNRNATSLTLMLKGDRPSTQSCPYKSPTSAAHQSKPKQLSGYSHR